MEQSVLLSGHVQGRTERARPANVNASMRRKVPFDHRGAWTGERASTPCFPASGVLECRHFGRHGFPCIFSGQFSRFPFAFAIIMLSRVRILTGRPRARRIRQRCRRTSSPFGRRNDGRPGRGLLWPSFSSKVLRWGCFRASDQSLLGTGTSALPRRAAIGMSWSFTGCLGIRTRPFGRTVVGVRPARTNRLASRRTLAGSTPHQDARCLLLVDRTNRGIRHRPRSASNPHAMTSASP